MTRSRILCAAFDVGNSGHESPPLGLSYIETKEFKLVFRFPGLYCAARGADFTNSLAWQRKILGWVPSEPSIVLLQDSDTGNAIQFSAPHNKLIVEVEPIFHAFEPPVHRAHVFSDES